MDCTSQQLILLTSPPASGKTFWIKAYSEKLSGVSILVIVPLRALVEECRTQWGEHVQIMTPEAWFRERPTADIVIFDEFHLWFYWGDSFRQKMWEVFFDLSQTAWLSIALTATVSPFMLQEIENFQFHFDRITWIDCGNQKLKFRPSLYLKCPGRSWMMNEIVTQEKNAGVRLIFCQFRHQVHEIEKQLIKEGYSTVSCIGGEAQAMKGKLQLLPRPDYIISTTVLSHGVNLPEISKIYFLYQVKNQDFWIQMVARGGRKGGQYEVFSLEKPQGLDWNPVQNFLLLVKHTLLQKLKLNIALLMKF